MTSQEIKNQFNPTIVDFGVIKDKSKKPYTVVNSSPLEIESVRTSCGCVGPISTDGYTITGETEAEYKPGKKQPLFLVDGDYCQEVEQPNGKKYLSVTRKVFIDNPASIQPVDASKYEQHIIVKMKDGESDEIVGDNRQAQDNPNKIKFNIPIVAWVLK